MLVFVEDNEWSKTPFRVIPIRVLNDCTEQKRVWYWLIPMAESEGKVQKDIENPANNIIRMLKRMPNSEDCKQGYRYCVSIFG
jgi:hypothetical protein